MRNCRFFGFALLLSALLCLSSLGPVSSVCAQESESEFSTSRGIELYKRGDALGAAKALSAVVKKHSSDANAWYLGLAFNSQGWMGAARVPFEHVIALRPGSPNAHAKLSYALILANEPDKATTIANRAIDLGDNTAAPYYALAEASLKLAAARRFS